MLSLCVLFLLPMGRFHGIPIFTAREAIERLEVKSKT